MAWDTYKQAKDSLREFSPEVRDRHTIVKFWSTTHGRFRYCRVYGKA